MFLTNCMAGKRVAVPEQRGRGGRRNGHLHGGLLHRRQVPRGGDTTAGRWNPRPGSY